MTTRHSDACAPACLFCVDSSGRRRRGGTVIHVRPDAWIRLRLDPWRWIRWILWIGRETRSAKSAREVRTLRPSEGSLACTDREVVQQLLPSSRSRRAIRAPANPRSVRCVVRRRTVASLAPAAEARRPRFDGRSKQGGVVGCRQVYCRGRLLRKSPCISATTVVLSNASRLSWSSYCAAGLGRVVRGVLVSFIACWLAPTTAYRKIDKQDQCHHGCCHPRAEHGAPQQKVRGSFFASSPGSILTSVEALSSKEDQPRVGTNFRREP